MCISEIDSCISSSSEVVWSWWVVLEVFSRQYFNAYFSSLYFSKCVFLKYSNLNWLLHQKRQRGCLELMSCSWSISQDFITMRIFNKCIFWVSILWNWLLHQHQQQQQPGCLELMSRKLRKWEFEFPSLPSMSEHHHHENVYCGDDGDNGDDSHPCQACQNREHHDHEDGMGGAPIIKWLKSPHN